MRKPITFVLLGVSLLLAACSAPAMSTPVGPDLIVGAPMSLTGYDSKDGALAKLGYDLWARWANQQGGVIAGGQRHRVQVRYEDDQSQPVVAGTVAGQLVSTQGARFLLGTYGAGTTAAEAAAAEKAGVPLLATNGADSIYSHGYQNVFGVSAPDNNYLRDVLQMAATLKPKPTTVAVLSADDQFSVDAAQAAVSYAPHLGMRVVFNQVYPSGSTQLTSVLTKAKEAAPDILLNSAHLIESTALTAAARDARLDTRILAQSQGPSDPGFVQALGKDADGIYSGAQWGLQSANGDGVGTLQLSPSEFVNAYRKISGRNDAPPDAVAAATAAGLALQMAIEKSDSLDAGQVRQALRSLDQPTFFGTIKFNSQGVNTGKRTMTTQIQGGAPRAVWPAQLATTQPRYPTPPWSTRTTAPPLGPAPKAPATGQV